MRSVEQPARDDPNWEGKRHLEGLSRDGQPGLVAAVLVLALYGGWRASRDEPGVRGGLVVRLAIGWFVFVAFWLLYVIAYCECV